MSSLGDVVAAAGPAAVELDVFGTTDPSQISSMLSSLTLLAAGVDVGRGLWYRSSVAAVAGVVLDDGRHVVVRAYRRDVSSRFLDGVVRVQRHLAGSGFPCAAPLGEPVVMRGLAGRLETMRDDPGPRRPALREVAASARGLSQVIDRAARVDPSGLDAHPMLLTDERLYPPPHSPLFDFDATAAGAEWIDDIASSARERMTDDRTVVAHGDWSARNVRLGGGALLCAYDWESLQHCPESTAVGIAAATWRALGVTGEPLAPAAPEIERYVEQYQLARGRPFTTTQRRSALAAAVYTLAYTARCEHALTPGTTTGRASGRLAADDGLRSLLT